jgi:hypothetical protein
MKSVFANHKILLFYYCLLLRELFSYSVVLWGKVPEPTARPLYLTRQHYRKTVLEGEDNNIFSTLHPIPDIKEKHTQIQHNNNNKIYNVALYLHCQTWPCWQQTTARVYFKGDKSWQKYVKIKWENLCHRYSAPGKSFETGIVPIVRYSPPLSSVLFKNSTHWLSNQNTTVSYVRY